jgi:hypothetical protein
MARRRLLPVPWPRMRPSVIRMQMILSFLRLAIGLCDNRKVAQPMRMKRTMRASHVETFSTVRMDLLLAWEQGLDTSRFL